MIVKAAVIGAVIVLPFVILQWVNTTVTMRQATDLVVLFGFLWLLASAFVFTLASFVRHRRYAFVNIALLIVLAVVFGGVVLDQLPCFLGIPNCD